MPPHPSSYRRSSDAGSRRERESIGVARPVPAPRDPNALTPAVDNDRHRPVLDCARSGVAHLGVSPGTGDLVTGTLAALSGPPSAVIALPERPGCTADWPQWTDPRLRSALSNAGIDELWDHQVTAADAAWQGRHVVLATGTASGKSLAYWLPSLSAILCGTSTALYCTPTKALANDQLARVNDLGLPEIEPACYDGDTDRDIRPLIRRRSRFVLTNPDMLHRSVLPGHPKWRHFLSRLRFVVLDEGHMYRGIFGANVAAVLTRLRRICHELGSDPVFILCSATLGNPEQAAAQLLGLPTDDIVAITADTSSRGARTVILHDGTPRSDGRNPDDEARARDSDDPVAFDDDQPDSGRSAFAETAAVLSHWVAAGAQSVGFVRSRAGVEAMAAGIRSRTAAGDRVSAYRGGLLPEERRAIESGLRSGAISCVAATNALELGVDITGLDAVAMCGWPGTRLSFLQQLGRAGRTGAHAVAVLTAQQDPLDRYYVSHPERIFDGSLESTVLDRDNPYVLLGHIGCAVAEQPMTTAQAVAAFGPVAEPVLRTLADHALIRLRGERWYWVARESASSRTDLRGSAEQISIVESDTGRVMGSVDGSSATSQLHPGAVYLHLGVSHVVESLDLDTGVAVVRRAKLGYSTVARSISDLDILDEHESRPLGAGSLHVGEVQVTSQVVGYLKREVGSGRVLGNEPLTMPPAHLRTTAVWWQIDDTQIDRLIPRDHVPGAAHAAEHAAIGVLPALATCDRWDIGGLSTPHHRDTGATTVFVYDGHPGGAGFARRGYDAAEEWLAATLSVVASCECSAGCPSCVQSPKCGNGNNPLDKSGGVTLLQALVAGTVAAGGAGRA